MKNFYKSLGLGLLFYTGTMLAQTVNPCASTEFTNKLRAEHPELQQQFDAYNQSLLNNARTTTNTGITYIIPVVFHVIHVNGSENISDAAIFAQMNRLNLDYRKWNVDTSSIIKPFKALATDVNVEFRLAQIDPNGNCTNGIERIYSHKTFQANDATKLNQWPREKYLNVWVCHDLSGSTSSSTILGYAYFPSDAAGSLFPYDGIICVYNTINGTSRTLTHEVGHWLSLQHTWGSGEVATACGDDLVDDTPFTKGHFSTCPPLDAACGLNPFTANFKFDSVTTTSSNVDSTSIAPVIVGATVSDFEAVGVSANSSSDGKFEFSDWSPGASDGNTDYTALTGAIDPNKYYEVKFTPQSGYIMKYTQINFSVNRNLTGARTFAIRSSRDNFAANLGTASLTGNTDTAYLAVKTGNVFYLKKDTNLTFKTGKFTITSTLLANDTMPVTFRIYAWNAEDPAGTFGLDSVNIIGSSDVIENVQNYMDYSSCTYMFSKKQAERMRTALESPVSGRNNLWSTSNHIATGILNPLVCVPKADFYSDKDRVCKGDIVKFTRNITRATPSSYTWTFEGGTPSTVTGTSTTNTAVSVTYNTPGLFKVTLSATSSAGVDSIVKTQFVRVDEDWADVDYNGSFTEPFQNTTHFYWDWQVRNLDNNPNTWAVANNTGYNSTQSVVMQGFGGYRYDVDELVSPAYDLSYTSSNLMTFRCAAASRGGASSEVNDQLKIYISKDCGKTWFSQTTPTSWTFKDSTLINNGYQANYFTPNSASQWALKKIVIPTAYNTDNVRFKFEYTTGSASNNVYIDDINLSGVVGINESSISNSNLSIYPNPTSQTSTIAYHIDKNSTTKVEIIDVLGKTVFVQANPNQAEGDYSILISKQNQNLKNGIYFVKFSIDNESTTKKLIITE